MFRGHNKIYIPRDSQGETHTLWGALRAQACRFPAPPRVGTQTSRMGSHQPYWIVIFFLFCRVEWVREVAPARWPLSRQRELGRCLTITPLTSWLWWVLNPNLWLWPLTRSIGHRKMALSPHQVPTARHITSQTPAQPESLQLPRTFSDQRSNSWGQSSNLNYRVPSFSQISLQIINYPKREVVE